MPTELLDRRATETQLATTPAAGQAKPTQAILLCHSIETIDRLKAETKTVDEKCDLATCAAAWWKWVKVRTGIKSNAEEITEESRQYVADVNGKAKQLIEYASSEEKRLFELKESKLKERGETRRFRLMAQGVTAPDEVIDKGTDEEFETVFAERLEAKRLKDDEDARRKAESERLAAVAKEQADKQAELDRQAAAQVETQRQLDDDRRRKIQL